MTTSESLPSVSASVAPESSLAFVGCRRLLHVFELRGGKISREQVWCDLAAIQRQLGCVVS